jgi:hypothetical protein
LLIGRGILRQGRFLKFGDKVRATTDKLEEAFLWRGKQDVEGFDMRIQAELPVLGEDPFGVVFVIGRANVREDSAE